ncbi:hypothetical protein FF098_009615 [Parvularcula flava]|nr:hypothetical protein [Aquisalinus luteolus]NHK28159.1 hypothetical protein [Aquisalinus luteolus]
MQYDTGEPSPKDRQVALCNERLSPIPGWDVDITENAVFLTLSQGEMDVQISDDWPVEGQFRIQLVAEGGEASISVQPGYVNLPDRTRPNEYFWEDVLLTASQGGHALFISAVMILDLGIEHNGVKWIIVKYATDQDETALLRTAAETGWQDIRFDFTKADAAEPFVRITVAPDVLARGFPASLQLLDWRDRGCPVE